MVEMRRESHFRDTWVPTAASESPRPPLPPPTRPHLYVSAVRNDRYLVEDYAGELGLRHGRVKA
ncbi:hypothetical protein DL990_33085 [Amycolatopsis sp. WAC 01416]|nr:hypothetical protein DL990_33085 [Amycolatopsis sp. WAC 01416]